MSKLRPVFKCHGGKYYLATWVTSYFPLNYEKLKYIEVYGGAGSVLLNKKVSLLTETYNDLNPKIANIFHCLKHSPIEFVKILREIEYSEDSFVRSAEIPFCYGSVESAIAELVKRRMSRGGLGKTFSWSDRLRGGLPGDLDAWRTFKLLIPRLINRLSTVNILNQSDISIIEHYADSQSLIYCDPPYVHSTRTAKNAYDFELNNEDHRALGRVLNRAKAKIIVSGYDCALYQEIFKTWKAVYKTVKNNSSQSKIKSDRVEVMWFNY